MTNTVAKGANRAYATEKTNRHAQRTPLPPRPGVVEAARADLNLRDGRGGLVKAPSSNEETPDERSHKKAGAFLAKAVASGWTGAIDLGSGSGLVEVVATRGAETLVQAWRNGVWDYSVSFYGYGDRTTKPRNASGALKLLDRDADAAAAEAAKVASNKHFRKAEPKDLATTLESARKALPFDPELAPDEEVSGILAGQALVWYNRISRGQESAIVGRTGIRLTRLPNGDRIANFCCPATGYRSCLVTAILKVGRGRNATTKGADAVLVEVS
jgi:hypothetical protein